METTFISIHDLSAQAYLLYASDSIIDILGYSPHEVIGRSCFEYFHPDEIPFARSVHGRGVRLDKAAVLSYCRIKSKYGDWVGCECAFTIVYDVLLASTSIYRRGMKSQKRAVEAPIIRRLFSSSPKDPRYHMLSHLSAKFVQRPSIQSHEPRAALFLNRFTRTLAIMYATTALPTVLGLTAEEAKGKSFYECIQENCLPEAIRCLESAKANDSIAYLRFWFRDPRQDDQPDQTMTDTVSSDEDEEGGVHLNDCPGQQQTQDQNQSPSHADSSYHSDDAGPNSRSSSGDSAEMAGNSNEAIFGNSRIPDSSASSLPSSDDDVEYHHRPTRQEAFQAPAASIEVEAVVSCTSDGLLVVLRRARPITTTADPTAAPFEYTNGLFASPWSTPPIMPRPAVAQPAFNGAFLPDLATASAQPNAYANVATGPGPDEFMNSIRDVAAFAWSLTGINGSLAQYGRGNPTGESQPPEGFPIWEPQYGKTESKFEENVKYKRSYSDFPHDIMNHGRTDNTSRYPAEKYTTQGAREGEGASPHVGQGMDTQYRPDGW